MIMGGLLLIALGSLLRRLAATNVLGLNAPAIADVEAHYVEMVWVQGINRGSER